MLSHPPHCPDLAPADFSISSIKNCDKKDEVCACFIDPTDCDERTEGDTGRNVVSVI
jgi:hypothetical protein